MIFLAKNENSNDLPEISKENTTPQNIQEKVQLQKSVATASGSEKNIVDAPASVTVITKEELEQKPYRDLGEALKEVPGVSLEGTSNKLGANAISIRGMPAGYTLLLTDGLRQNPSGDVATANLGVGVYNTFMPPMSAIERIEVIRGPMSTLYGSDALGGVINVITKPISKVWSGSFSSQLIVPETRTFGNTYQNSLYITGPLSENLGLTLRARQTTREASEAIKNDRGQSVSTFFGTQYVAYNIGGRLTYLANTNNQIYADVDYTKSTYDNQTGQIGTLGANLNTANNTYTGGYEPWVGVNKLNTALAHKGEYSFGNWKSSLQYMRSENTGRLVVGSSSNPNATKNRGISSDDIIADSRVLLHLGEHNNLNVGAEYRFEKYHDLAATPANHNRHTAALFAEDEWNIFDPLTFTFGARYNYNDKFGSNVSPRAYLVFEIADGLAIKGGVATGYKAPYANQLIDAVYGYGRQGALPFIGNSNLKPESSVSYEIGMVADNEYINASLTLFRSNFKDKIESQTVTNTNAACATSGSTSCSMVYNADTAYSQGIEASANIKPIYGIGLDASYTYIDSEITSGTNSGQPLSTTAKHNLFGKISYTYAKFHIYLQAHYKSGIINTSAIDPTTAANIALRNALGGQYYKPSTQLNLGLGYKITDNVRLNGGIYNLLNKQFTDFRAYDYQNNQTTQTANINLYGPVIQEGRRYYLNITLDF